MDLLYLRQFVVGFAAFCLMTSAPAESLRSLHGHVPQVIARNHLQALERVPATNRFTLAIGLPLHNTNELNGLIQQLYDPSSPRFHHYFTAEQFAKSFGPTEGEYAAVAAFAASNGLAIVGTHSNRMVLDVSGPAAAVEKAFNVKMNLYQHPTENRAFFAPDAEPSVPASLPVLSVGGLNNYTLPHPNLKPKAAARAQGGSAPYGNFMGNDFRAAYVPGTALTGAGQSVGLLQLGSGFYQSDITAYENQAGLPNVPVTAVLIDGYDGGPGAGNDEVSLDIEMAISMAPGLSHVYVYEGNQPDDILNRMAQDSSVKQLSASWSYTTDAATEQIFQEFAAQGQSFFNASGDGDAWVGTVYSPCDDPNITLVGGTTLSMTGNGSSYGSETVWNDGYNPPGWVTGDNYWGSGGGVSTVFSIPVWQQGLSMTANQGSTSMRNIPDVSMNGDNVWVVYGGGTTGSFMGTSCAAPLWAGFTALANQQAASNGLASVGFLNPALYSLGKGLNYSANFHDITTGNNAWSESFGKYNAVAGYDLCTGWGTPGTNLINALAPGAGYQGGFTFSTNADNTLTVTGYAGPPWSVTIPSTTNGLTVTCIGTNAFLNSPATSVTIPTSVKTIEFQAFLGSGVVNMTIPNSVTNIGAQAFLDCGSLTNASVGNGVVYVDSEAFGYCPNLASIYFLGNAPAIGSNVFYHDSAATLFYFYGTTGWTSPFAGLTAFMLDGPAPTGSLQVTISPAAAVSAGAQWQLDGGLWEMSGATVNGLATGSHTVSFSSLNGWTSPATQTVTVTANSTATLTGTYSAVVTTGSAQVTIQPDAAVSAGAQWQLDGTNETSGAIVSGLSAGNHALAFTAVSGWTAPLSQTISVVANTTNSVTVTYTAIPQTGSLKVMLTPAIAVIAGATWQLAGGTPQNSQALVSGLSPGNYTISFNPAPGWTPPANQVVSVAAGATSYAMAAYSQTATPTGGIILLTNGAGGIRHAAWPGTLEFGKNYSVTAVPQSGNLFDNWTDAGGGYVYATSARYSFTARPGLVLQANFVTNVFVAAQGQYRGLFAPTNARAQNNSGSFTLSVTSGGALSGSLRLGAQTKPLRGKFNLIGEATVLLADDLTVVLQLDPTNHAMTGQVAGANFTAPLLGCQNVFSARHPALAWEGRYTLVMPGVDDPALGPFGTSYGTLTVSPAGAVSLAGSLADGVAISQSSVISSNGSWPLYIPLYGGKGSLWGWVSLANGAVTSDIGASWINPGNGKSSLYADGFTNQAVAITGTNYDASNISMVGLTQGSVVLAGGDLPEAVTNPITRASGDKLFGATSNLTLTINKSTGIVTGSFQNPSNPRQTLKLGGVWLSGPGTVEGYFPGTNQSGSFLLTGQ